MNFLPKVSIITPSYNQAEYLERTILSVLKQDYNNIEYIIIDGGSNDGSIEIIKKYESRLAYWVSEKDNGQSNAINKGFSKASGEIFYWINSDDILLPSAVSIAVKFFSKHDDWGMVFGDRLIIDFKDQVLRCTEYSNFNLAFFFINHSLPQETAFFRRDVWQKVKGVNEEYHIAMDTDLWFRIQKVTKIKHLPFILGCYREHENAKSYQNFGNCAVSKIGSDEVSRINKMYVPLLFRIKSIYILLRKMDKIRGVLYKFSKQRKLLVREVNDMLIN